MALENKVYVPTLAVRASEMNGLEFLPGAIKDRMTPCFLLAPWANSNSLERAITRIERAFPNRNYFLDIDKDYECTNPESLPQIELQQLRDPQNCYENWVKFAEAHEFLFPCIQLSGQTKDQIKSQIRAIQLLNKSYCMRISKDNIPSNIDDVIRAFADTGVSDFMIILEGGWTNDSLSLFAWFNGFISESLSIIDASVPIVLSCTSIPNMFTSFNGTKPTKVPFGNRQLLEQVSRNSNRTRIIYGDWGSTRPRHAAGFANRPLDRVDYPTAQAWYIARNKEDEWDFRDAALAIVNSPEWDGSLGIWGEEMIQNTTINKELGIDTPQKNIASRVNIHLYRQSIYGTPPINPSSLDEDWED